MTDTDTTAAHTLGLLEGEIIAAIHSAHHLYTGDIVLRFCDITRILNRIGRTDLLKRLH